MDNNSRENKNESMKFKNVAKKINAYLKEEDTELSFKGYDETICKYFSIDDCNLTDIYDLINQCNLWSNYMSELSSFIIYKKSMYETHLDYLKALYDKKNPNEQLEKQIKDLSVKTKVFSLFDKQLKSQSKFFTGAYYHCKQIYGSGINTLKYKTC